VQCGDNTRSSDGAIGICCKRMMLSQRLMLDMQQTRACSNAPAWLHLCSITSITITINMNELNVDSRLESQDRQQSPTRLRRHQQHAHAVQCVGALSLPAMRSCCIATCILMPAITTRVGHAVALINHVTASSAMMLQLQLVGRSTSARSTAAHLEGGRMGEICLLHLLSSACCLFPVPLSFLQPPT
jgi:hypothetical protein